MSGVFLQKLRSVTPSNSLACFQYLIGNLWDFSGDGLPVPRRRAGPFCCGFMSLRFAVDSGVKPILLSATMKTALILVGKRVGKAV
jgi:hypothetical protein